MIGEGAAAAPTPRLLGGACRCMRMDMVMRRCHLGGEEPADRPTMVARALPPYTAHLNTHPPCVTASSRRSALKHPSQVSSSPSIATTAGAPERLPPLLPPPLPLLLLFFFPPAADEELETRPPPSPPPPLLLLLLLRFFRREGSSPLPLPLPPPVSSRFFFLSLPSSSWGWWWWWLSSCGGVVPSIACSRQCV